MDVRSGTGLRLVCPGLVPDGCPVLDRLPPTPSLDRILARADRLDPAPNDGFRALAESFGLAVAPDADPPSAPLCLLAEAPEQASRGVWFHADPIHLRPDRDRLRLFGGPSLALRAEETEALIAAFNAHFAADGLELVATRPQRWYLRVAALPDLRTTPLTRVQGRAIDPYLPAGPAARAWMRWQNEAQMLFFQHPVNAARDADGRPTVSGIWTWGGGALPAVGGGPDLTFADHPLALGLAQAARCRTLALDAALPPTGADRVLIYWDRLWWPSLEGDWARWLQALAALETQIAALAGAYRALRLDDGDGRSWMLAGAARHRFWRRGGLRERIARAQERKSGADARAPRSD